MFNKQDITRNEYMLDGCLRKNGYDWWWHSFTGINEKTGEEIPFFIEFFLCNPDLAKDVPVLGQLKENRVNKIKPSYLMVKVGCWGEEHKQIHRFFPWKDIEVNGKSPFSIRAEDCFLSENRTYGKVVLTKEECEKHPEYMCDFGEMEWDLEICKDIAFNVGYGAGLLCRKLKAFEMYWHAEGMKSRYSGTVTIDGEKYVISKENSYGYADKNWGKGFTSPWVWLSSNHMVSNITGKKLENSVFDIGGGRPKVYFIPLNRKLLGAFYYEGKEYEFNFSKFWTGTKTKFKCIETEDEVIWYVIQENRKAIMKTNVRCSKKDMLLINYEAPDGSKRHNRLWNGGNGTGRIQLFEKIGDKKTLIDDISIKNIGCEYGEYDS